MTLNLLDRMVQHRENAAHLALLQRMGYATIYWGAPGDPRHNGSNGLSEFAPLGLQRLNMALSGELVCEQVADARAVSPSVEKALLCSEPFPVERLDLVEMHGVEGNTLYRAQIPSMLRSVGAGNVARLAQMAHWTATSSIKHLLAQEDHKPYLAQLIVFWVYHRADEQGGLCSSDKRGHELERIWDPRFSQELLMEAMELSYLVGNALLRRSVHTTEDQLIAAVNGYLKQLYPQ